MAERSDIVHWVARHILPLEGEVRGWLRSRILPADIDDVVQEAYCRIAGLKQVAHIADSRAYFFQVVRNILLEQVRRAHIVRIDVVAEMDALNISDDRPSPEQEVSAHRELKRLQHLIDELPERCRQVFVLRKIEGVPQKEIARRLNITEHTVEAHVGRGLQMILKSWSQTAQQDISPRQGHERKRKRD